MKNKTRIWLAAISGLFSAAFLIGAVLSWKLRFWFVCFTIWSFLCFVAILSSLKSEEDEQPGEHRE